MNSLVKSLILIGIIAGFYFVPLDSYAITVGPAKIDVSIAARIVSRELAGILNFNRLKLKETKINSVGISGLVSLIKDRKVSDKNAKESLIKYVLEGLSPKEFLEKKNLLIDVSEADLGSVVEEVIKSNESAFQEFKSGNKKSLNFLIGQVMRKMKGKVDARQVQKILEGM